MNQHRAGRVLLHLLAKTQHVDIDRTVGDGAILTPYRVEELLATEHYAGPAHQEFQQAELRRRQREELSIEAHLTAGAVELHAAGLQYADRRRLIAELQFDARDQLAHEERLDHVIVGAELQTDDAVGFAGAGGQEDHRGLREIRVLPDALADVQTVGIGKHDVEQDEVGTHLAAKLDGAAASLQAGERKALFFEVVFE